MGGILLIDDAELARKLQKRVLVEEGYEVCGEAGNGKEGLEKYKELKPDLVFCDIFMRELDGQECLKAIVREDPDANVVICSSVSEPPVVEEAYRNGAKGFLDKPISSENLLKMAQKFIGRPRKRVRYGDLMEKRALSMGIEEKPILDFFEAFRKISGFSMNDPRVDGAYLKENGEEVFVTARAILAGKMSGAQLKQVEDVFDSLL